MLDRTDPLQNRLLYMSGPSFAKEMMENHPIALTLHQMIMNGINMYKQH